MTLQRINFINKLGYPFSMVLDIIRKKSKVIETRNLEDNSLFDIPRGAVEDISDPDKKQKEEED